MGKIKDLTGQKFGKLIVLGLAFIKNHYTYWKCQCECGKECIKLGCSLVRGQTKSCGCSGKKNKFIDLTNKKFGKLTVIKKDHSTAKGDVYWLCKCDCGNHKVVRGANLRYGKIKSCGCLKDLAGKTFGKLNVISKLAYDKNKKQALWLCKCTCGQEITLTTNQIKKNKDKFCSCSKDPRKKRIISIWGGMKRRCLDAGWEHYKYYGGKGISICQEWLSSSNAFYKWAITNGYENDLTIDRIDPSGDYEPSNCRWVDMKTQAVNKTKNINKNNNLQGKIPL